MRYDAPVARTREIVEICRAVWRRERLEHDGPHYRIPLPADEGTGLGKPLRLVNHPVRERIPIALAALGPRDVALAAAASRTVPFVSKATAVPLAKAVARIMLGASIADLRAEGCCPARALGVNQQALGFFAAG